MHVRISVSKSVLIWNILKFLLKSSEVCFLKIFRFKFLTLERKHIFLPISLILLSGKTILEILIYFKIYLCWSINRETLIFSPGKWIINQEACLGQLGLKAWKVIPVTCHRTHNYFGGKEINIVKKIRPWLGTIIRTYICQLLYNFKALSYCIILLTMQNNPFNINRAEMI